MTLPVCVDPIGFVRFQAVQAERRAVVRWLRGQERTPGELEWIVLSLEDEDHLS